jgi:hypothetical protein
MVGAPACVWWQKQDLQLESRRCVIYESLACGIALAASHGIA